SVARALWRHRSADLINVGFAFPTLPNVPLTKKNFTEATPPSWAFKAVLDAIDDEHVKGKLNRYPFILAPAGNQSSSIPQYPAAFGLTHENVIGVGSTTPDG